MNMFIDKYIIYSGVYLRMKYNVNNNNITLMYGYIATAAITA